MPRLFPCPAGMNSHTAGYIANLLRAFAVSEKELKTTLQSGTTLKINNLKPDRIDLVAVTVFFAHFDYIPLVQRFFPMGLAFVEISETGNRKPQERAAYIHESNRIESILRRWFKYELKESYTPETIRTLATRVAFKRIEDPRLTEYLAHHGIDAKRSDLQIRKTKRAKHNTY